MMDSAVWGVVSVFGALFLAAFGKWVAWSAKQGVKDMIGPLSDRVTAIDAKLHIIEPLTLRVSNLDDSLRAHMAEEGRTAAVNAEQHEEFRRRITSLER